MAYRHTHCPAASASTPAQYETNSPPVIYTPSPRSPPTQSPVATSCPSPQATFSFTVLMCRAGGSSQPLVVPAPPRPAAADSCLMLPTHQPRPLTHRNRLALRPAWRKSLQLTTLILDLTCFLPLCAFLRFLQATFSFTVLMCQAVGSSQP